MLDWPVPGALAAAVAYQRQHTAVFGSISPPTPTTNSAQQCLLGRY